MVDAPLHVHAPGCPAPLGGTCTCKPMDVAGSDEQPAAAFLVGGQRYESSLTGEDIDDNLLLALERGGEKVPVPDVPVRGVGHVSAHDADHEDDSISIAVLISLIVVFGFVALVARPQLATSPGFAWLISIAIVGLVVIGVVDRVFRHVSR